jgi:pilus assembly protein CpaD
MIRSVENARHLRRCLKSCISVAIATTAVTVSACTRLDDYTAAELNETPKRHPIGYAAQTEALLVEVPPSGGLSANQQADVVRFVDRYRKEGTGRLQLSAPRGAGAHLAASRSMREVESILVDAGIDGEAIQMSRHNISTSAGPAVKLAYDKPVAVPPQCGDWATNLGENRERLPYNNFGCATQRNFALTVANARDLQVPQPETPRSSERRSAAWSSYTGTANSKEDAAAAAAPAQKTTTR